MNNTLKKCKAICDKYEKKVEGFYEEGDLYLEFCDDSMNLGFLLAVCDGYVDPQEIYTINATFSVLMDYSLLANRYGIDYMSENGFLQQVPPVIKKVAEAEKKSEFGAPCFLTDTRELYNAMKQFGNVMINCNGNRLKFAAMLLNHFCNVVLDYIFAVEEKDEFALEGGEGNYSENEPEEKEKLLKIPFEAGKKKPAVPASAPIEKAEKKEQELVQRQLAEDKDTLFQRDSLEHIDDINEVLKKVDALTGLGSVKKEIHDMVNLMIVQKMRQKKGLKTPPISRHLVFTGNPGTGKTTIARMMAQIYKCLGILELGHLVETDRSGLVAGYMGQTAEKVKEVTDSARGGVLFIDEAYTLAIDREGDFGQEAIDTLLKIMEDNREDLVVIVAGYTDRMEGFLDSNPGLRSRFNKYIHFDDYSAEELLEIFGKYCMEQDYILKDSLHPVLLEKIRKMKEDEQENFGNARTVRNYFEKVISNQANRIMQQWNIAMDGDADALQEITTEDL